MSVSDDVDFVLSGRDLIDDINRSNISSGNRLVDLDRFDLSLTEFVVVLTTVKPGDDFNVDAMISYGFDVNETSPVVLRSFHEIVNIVPSARKYFVEEYEGDVDYVAISEECVDEYSRRGYLGYIHSRKELTDYVWGRIEDYLYEKLDEVGGELAPFTGKFTALSPRINFSMHSDSFSVESIEALHEEYVSGAY